MELINTTTLIFIIMTLAQLLKTAWKTLPKDIIPFIVIAMAIGLTWYFIPAETIRETIWNGILCGLTSMGLYSGGKNVAQGVTQRFINTGDTEPKEGE